MSFAEFAEKLNKSSNNDLIFKANAFHKQNGKGQTSYDIRCVVERYTLLELVRREENLLECCLELLESEYR